MMIALLCPFVVAHVVLIGTLPLLKAFLATGGGMTGEDVFD